MVSRTRFGSFISAFILLFLWALPTVAQLPPTLDRGHRILLQRGSEIQAQAFWHPTGTFDFNRWATSNFTTVNWQWGGHPDVMGTPPGIPWGRWAGDPGQTTLHDWELPYITNFTSLQLSDEQDLNSPTVRESVIPWFQQARLIHANTLLYTNQWGNQVASSAMTLYMAESQPDMLMFDSYPFRQSPMTGGSPTTLYAHMAKYRALAMAGNDGSGARPIPFGHYMQTYKDGSELPRFPSDSEMRLEQFAGWTFGEKFISAFTYNSPAYQTLQPSFFVGLGDSTPTAAFNQIAETNRQSRNVGKALVALLSSGVRIIPGQNTTTGTNATPSGMSNWTPDAGPYITAIAATNLGTKNNGLRGDVLLGYFRPLDESFDGPLHSNETYFMITNGLSDYQGLASETRQRVTVDFDFGLDGITSLQRLSRQTGAVETVPLTLLGGSLYRLAFDLDGGTGDLFKFNDGAPFVVPEPSAAVLGACAMFLLVRRRHRGR